MHMDFNWVNTVISDSLGAIQFYSNGCDISTNLDGIMKNGENINPGPVHNLKCQYGTYSAGPQSILTLPIPKSKKKYMIFHEGIKYVEQPVFDVLTDKLYISIVDMEKNNQEGEVVLKNHPIMIDSLNGGELTAVKHANGEDWWVVAPKDRTNRYYSFLLTQNGIADTIESFFGEATYPAVSGGGQAVFTPDGSKYIRFNTKNMVRMVDFDRNTGTFSDYKKINIDLLGFSTNFGGCAISPNSRFLYLTTFKYLYQLDLEADDIEGSAIVIEEWDGTAQPWLGATFYLCQLAPDCRIYITSPNSVDVMHVIKQPNEKGTACDFVQNGVKLPTLNFVTIPNFPNYRQGPEGEDYMVCDSTVQVFTPFFEQEPVTVFPNPASSEVNINLTLPSSTQQLLRLELSNTLGQTVQIHQVKKTGEIKLNVEEVPNGMYYINLFSKNKRIAVKKLVVAH